MIKRLSWLSLGVVTTIISQSPKTLAHNTQIVYRQTEAVEIVAQYDNGSPIANAQVVVYAPNNETQPWQKGTTDNEGKFMFVPNSSITGNWSVKVRSAGHGGIINIPVESSSLETNNYSEEDESTFTITQTKESSLANNRQPSIFQKMMMAATGVWGFVGTALYFSRKKV